MQVQATPSDMVNMWRQRHLLRNSEDGDTVNRQGNDTATSAHFVRYRTNSTLSSTEPHHLRWCF